MPKGYWIANVTITDPDLFKTYQGMVEACLEQHGGRYLVRGGSCEQVEGTGNQRQVVVEFDTYAAALDCYRSAEYAEAIAMRNRAATTNLVVVEGVEGANPARL